MDGAWVAVCRAEDLLPESTVLLHLRGRSIALARTADEQLYALSGRETLVSPDSPLGPAGRPGPAGSGDSRGPTLVRWWDGVPTLVPGLRAHAFDLRTGACLDACQVRLARVPVRVVSGDIEVAA